VADLIYLLITLASFALLALLAGAIDRRLHDPGEDDESSVDTTTRTSADEAVTR